MTGQKWIWQSLVSAAMVAVLASRVPAQAPAIPPKPAASVNGEPITMADIDAVLKLRPPLPSQPTETQRRQMQMDVLSVLIDDTILQQFLRKNAAPVTPAEVTKEFEEMQKALKKQGRTLEDFYRETGQTEGQVRTNVANMLRRDAYVNAHLSDADALKYYNENRDFFDQVTVRASHIVLRVIPSSTASERQAARARLQAVRQEIVSGKIDFAEAAKKYSQSTSAANGGDIGSFPRRWAVDEAFAKAAFALQKGEISDVVETEYGLHLIKVTDRKPGQPSSFDRIKDEVRKIAGDEMLENILKEQRSLAKVEVFLTQEGSATAARP